MPTNGGLYSPYDLRDIVGTLNKASSTNCHVDDAINAEESLIRQLQFLAEEYTLLGECRAAGQSQVVRRLRPLVSTQQAEATLTRAAATVSVALPEKA